MKKIINQPQDFVDETLQGIVLAHPDKLVLSEKNSRAIVKKHLTKGKVAIVTGGGSGHLPLFLGYVGEGLADACAVGNVFASPSATAMREAALAAETGAGVLYLFGNYGGDKMNFEMASEDLEDLGVAVERVLGNDDVASADKEHAAKRRGVAGILFVYKIAGAAAARMLPLEEVARLARKANENTRSMGVALSACTIPDVGTPSFTIADDEMELGMGIHGEPGIHRGKMQTADEIAQTMCDAILADIEIPAGSRVGVLVNLLGATPKEEGYILFRKVHEILSSKNIEIVQTYVGEYSTSMEMAGASLSVIRLDDELESLLKDYASSPFFVLQEAKA